ncbi:MAG TPA: hypothetical protein VHS58_20960 [Acetobacteraceae bacterium]|jgi:hypothetical protein|nr:hypothetical protein [Acetobacteraceae bacterium]
MSEAPNGNGNPTAVSAISKATNRVIDALQPAQYLALIVLNVLMIGGLLVYMERREARRDEAVSPVIAACMNKVPVEVVEKLLALRAVPPP